MDFKLNIGDPKSGKTHKKDLTGDDAKFLSGKKIGEKIKGELIGLTGYEFEITGGSDFCGFPMRKDVRGSQRKKILIVNGVGTRHTRAGMRLRRTVAGNTIYAKTAQINLKILKQGKSPLDAAPDADAPTETPKAEVKEEAKPEAKAPKEESKAPKEEAKEEAAVEEKSEEPKKEVSEEKKE
jgi:small subunit ribosomal protein S6e